MDEDAAEAAAKKARRLAAARAMAAAGGLPMAASTPAAPPAPLPPKPFTLPSENTGASSSSAIGHGRERNGNVDGADGAALGIGLGRRTYGGDDGDAADDGAPRAEDDGHSSVVFKRNETIGYLDSASFSAASLDIAIPPENRGYRLLAKMGWRAGEGLGRRNSGIAAPIGLVAAEGRMGLGKAAEYDKANDEAARERRKLAVEREETDESRAASAAHAERDAARVDTLKRQNAEFYCAICDKQYKSVSEMSNHLSSYDHHHKKRFVEMKEAERARSGGDAAADAKRERERKREEKEMRRRMAAVGGGAAAAVAVPAVASLQPPPPPPPPRSLPTAVATAMPPAAGSALMSGKEAGAVSFSMASGKAPAVTGNGSAKMAFGFRVGANGRAGGAGGGSGKPGFGFNGRR